MTYLPIFFSVQIYPCHWSGYPTVFLSPASKGIPLSALFSSNLPSGSAASAKPSAPVCDDDDAPIAFPQWLKDDLEGVELPTFRLANVVLSVGIAGDALFSRPSLFGLSVFRPDPPYPPQPRPPNTALST